MSRRRINSMAELDEAQMQLSRKIREKESSILVRFEEARQFYNPSNMVNGFVQDYVDSFDWRAAALSIVRSLKEKLQ